MSKNTVSDGVYIRVGLYSLADCQKVAKCGVAGSSECRRVKTDSSSSWLDTTAASLVWWVLIRGVNSYSYTAVTVTVGHHTERCPSVTSRNPTASMPPVKVVFHSSPPSSGRKPAAAHHTRGGGVAATTSATELREEVERLRAEVGAERAKMELQEKAPGLRVCIGRALAGEPNVTELVKEKQISRMEFRKLMRKLLVNPDAKAVDDLFAELDSDHGGSLDAAEVQAAMRKLPALAKEADADLRVAADRMVTLTSRLAHAQSVLEATAAAEAAHARLGELRDTKSLNARVGALLAARNIKVADVVNTWIATKGEVSKAQFKKNLRALGLDDASLSESGALFDELDADCGGTLDLEELKAALIKLQEAARAAEREILQLAKSSAELSRSAKAAQAEHFQRRKRDEEADRMAAEAVAEEERRKAEAAEAAKEKRAAAEEERRKRKAQEQAAFDAKVAAKRVSVTVAGVPAAACSYPQAASLLTRHAAARATPIRG